MARQACQFSETGLYHIVFRGVNGKHLFVIEVYNMLQLNFQKNQYRIFIRYDLQTCESFSFIFEKSDYTFDGNSNKYLNQDIFYEVQNSIIDIKKVWINPATGSHFDNCDLIKIDCSAGSYLYRANDFFEWNGISLPEELCFYRNDTAWFTCTTHENICLIKGEKEEDIVFLKMNQIEYYVLS